MVAGSPIRKVRLVLAAVVVVSLISLGIVFWPRIDGWLTRLTAGSQSAGEHGEGAETHGGHDEHGHGGHDHAAHGDANSVELSPQALKNIGFEPLTVNLGEFERTMALPGMVVERQGKSQIRVSAPLTGVVTRILVIEGEAIKPGTALFELRLTHEDLVAAQGEFLKNAEELDVVKREIARLESISDGIIAGKRVLEQHYERQKLEAVLKAQREALLLHGLSDAQVDEILKSRKLLPSLTILAPQHVDDSDCRGDHMLHIQKLNVQVGQQVTAGDTMCVLADHCQLYIEGTAFEEDADRLRQSAASGGKIAVELLVSGRRQPVANSLKLLYVSDQVEAESRAFHFYLKLPNQVVLSREDDHHQFVQWRFQPGQRVELQIPYDLWKGRIVLPAEAVAMEGPEAYVYQQSGNHFRRVAVHVEHQDRKSVVIANDGSLFPGDVIAGRGAFQIHLALKNKSGGGIDPHAGHNH